MGPPKEGQGESAGGGGESVTVSLGYTSLETFPLCPVPCTPGMGSSSPTQSWAVTRIVLVAQSCLTLCDPVDCSPPVFSAFFREEYWSGLPFPSPGDIPEPGIQPRSPALQADSLPSEPPGKPMSPRQSCLKCEGEALFCSLSLALNIRSCDKP